MSKRFLGVLVLCMAMAISVSKCTYNAPAAEVVEKE